MRTERSDILTFLFWANFAAFSVHILDETLMGGGFVAGIQRHFWLGFTMSDFFTANAYYLILIAIVNLLYDWRGGWFAVIPLVLVWERSLNGLWHVGWTLFFKEYSPGLVTSPMFFVILYLSYRYGVLKGHMRQAAFFGGGIIAIVLETLLLSSLWWAH
ncbi:MAG: hypothetical protein A2Y65_02400 [Deltaproteobacteria bacterium RBG_13_52_11]|nr:MAG: hypothetical protein A2Y65_02400 [Deltaproteobacteria bacterium RBG_13_52_11]